jgi:hypothetical protein
VASTFLSRHLFGGGDLVLGKALPLDGDESECPHLLGRVRVDDRSLGEELARVLGKEDLHGRVYRAGAIARRREPTHHPRKIDDLGLLPFDVCLSGSHLTLQLGELVARYVATLCRLLTLVVQFLDLLLHIGKARLWLGQAQPGHGHCANNGTAYGEGEVSGAPCPGIGTTNTHANLPSTAPRPRPMTWCKYGLAPGC